MKRQHCKYLLILCALMGFSGLAVAETQYVSGEVKVNMRKGQGTDFAINEILTTNDKVQVLRSYKSGYSRIRTENGNVGYILTRFLTRDAPPTERIAQLKSELETLKAKNEELQASLQQSQGAVETAATEQGQLAAQNEQLRKRLAFIEETSANVVKIGDENQRMRERLLALEAEVSRLEQQNTELKTWYKGQNSGAMILGAGLLIGLVSGRLFRRRGGAWSSDRI